MTPEVKDMINQIRHGKVPKGYKKTKAGIVPLDWEIHALSEYLTESRIPGTNGAVAKKLTVKLWNKGVFEKQEIHKGSESTTYYKRKSGQLIYSKLDFLNCAFGIIPEQLDGYESTQDMPCFDIQDIDPHYLLTYVTQRNFYTHFGLIANGGRKARRIGSEDMLSFPIVYPPLIEQQKIVEILSTQDKLIELNQRKIEELKKLKKYCLNKMFPKKGSNVPEIRFKGFTEPWEQYELGAVIKENLKPVPKPIGEYTRLGIRSHAKGTFHEIVPAGEGLNVDTMYVVEANNLIVNITFAWEGAWAIASDEDAEKLVSHRFPQYKFNSDQYPMFYKYRLNNARMRYDLEIASPGGAGRN